MEVGDCPDLDILSRTFGAAVEYMLCDLFSQHKAAAHYWVDGVIIDGVTLQPDRIVVAKGRAWCADRREQWQIPAEIECRFSEGHESNLLSVAIRVGNAVMATLGDHRNRSIAKLGDPLNWLLEFEGLRKPFFLERVRQDKFAGP